MAPIAYALSIQHFINSVGAKAGFASIIGLALLVLLFFTQSRETANLRRRADEAEQQLYQLQLYIEHLSRQRSQQAAAPATAQTTGAPVAAPPAAAAALARAGASRAIPGEQVAAGAVATIPAAPAGVGAPALSSATRLIPLADPGEISIRALRPSTNGDGEGRAGDVSDATVATPPPTPPPGPAPSTAAGGGNGIARPPVVPMPTVGPPTASAPPPRVAPPRQQRPASPPPPRRSGRQPSGRRISPVFFVLAAILVAAVVAVILIFVSGGSNSSSSSSSSSGSSGASASASRTTAAKKGKGAKQRAVASVTPSSVTVAVLNATTTPRLAANVLGKLTVAGYKGGTTQNAAESGLSATIVGYTASSARADALAVARSLKLAPSSVQAVSQGDRLKVCGSTTACTTQVIVTLGADLAQTG